MTRIKITLKTAFILVSPLVLAGCFTGGAGTATDMVTATTALRGRAIA